MYEMMTREPEAVMRVDELIDGHARNLSSHLHKHLEKHFPPHARKSLRSFSSGEVARMVGVADGYLRTLSLENKGPKPATSTAGRRLYSAENILDLRRYLATAGKSERRYLPTRSGGEHLQVIATVNFKGGSGKTTTSAYLAQYLALRGYRVLALDLDPQASLTSLFGLQPELDLSDGQTLYGAIRYDQPVPLSTVIQPTYFPGIDLCPADLELMEFEHETPAAMHKRDDSLFFTRIDRVLAEVAESYDVVVIDCPPQLGFLTLSALCTATAVLITVHPQMLDVLSMTQFLKMASDLLSVVSRSGADLRYDWLRYVVTRYEPGDGPQNQMLAFMRNLFGDHVLQHPFLKSTAISDAAITKQTLYEIERAQFTRATYDRAMESIEAVNGEIEALIQAAWGRR